ncbi:MAG: preprotein translocase subunit Sec61beta [Nitrososphaerota archaeon]|jgi:preprotein translocase subunit Sec61beta|nr:preprotein translocase subunit Sec61beta [Nitrososphaerota archaeon]MDG7037569.1 preprotein translocase subunit Sec61beta [Nitrososphaerota archaeon]MDG7042584.1 preprotein translocase subunit Sec61beta [Nitrososphaerota archaeon]MDG7044161.1 preprotein translocase subunit Sec61beta [Nitrososphaerota archaeon]MDG7048363.1 preprotein translocase subunit Sec61beta [Nitrososphaerota archaeon]
MSSKKKASALPASSAGLLRFYETDEPGLKLRPEIVVIATIVFITLTVILPIIK